MTKGNPAPAGTFSPHGIAFSFQKIAWCKMQCTSEAGGFGNSHLKMQPGFGGVIPQARTTGEMAWRRIHALSLLPALARADLKNVKLQRVNPSGNLCSSQFSSRSGRNIASQYKAYDFHRGKYIMSYLLLPGVYAYIKGWCEVAGSV